MSHAATLEAEVATWLIEDDDVRAEKIQRERMRYPKLARDLLLDRLDTHRMDVIDVGGGPSPLSDLLRCRSRAVVDPLSAQYSEFFPCPDHVTLKAEEIPAGWAFDLAICTNALDHVEDPKRATERIARVLRPGGFFAIVCAENNAITHRHPAHVHNLTAESLHRWLDEDFETCWELNFREHGYRYGWVSYQGRRGQPAFALLMRKCVGYGS